MLSRLIFTTLTIGAICASTSFAFDDGDGDAPGGGDHPPVCNANGPYVIEANNTPGTTSTDVTLTSAGSFDPDGDPLSFFWFEECSHAFFADPTQADGVLTVDMTGVCSQVCLGIELRVTANGKTTKCKTSVTVQDTTAPTFVTCPPDAYLVWTQQLWSQGPSPLQTGFATVSDNSDPNPSLGFVDQFFTDPVGSGLEGHIVRTWTTTDACGNSNSTCSQTIFLASPKAAGGTNFDSNMEACPNFIDRNQVAPLNMVVLGNKTFNVANIDTTTLRLQRVTNTTQQFSLASAIFTFGDFGTNTALSVGQCNLSKKDGKLDLRIQLPVASIVPALGLDTESVGTPVDILLTGRDLTGKPFIIRDVAAIH